MYICVRIHHFQCGFTLDNLIEMTKWTSCAVLLEIFLIVGEVQVIYIADTDK